MQRQEVGLTIEELAERVGVPVRTVRFYISEGLLAGPGARGKAAVYSEEHLLQLLLIRRLVEDHVPLREIRERVSHLSAGDIRAILAEEIQREAVLRQAEGRLSPKEYISELLARARLARGMAHGESAAPAGGSRRPVPSLADLAEEPVGSARRLAAPHGEAPTDEDSSAPFALREPTFEAGEAVASAIGGEHTQGAEVWHRWELAPGVELHVRGDAKERHRKMIASLLNVAGRRSGGQTR